MAQVVAMDLGSTSFKGGIFASDGHLLHQHEIEVPPPSIQDLEVEWQPKEILERATALLNHLTAQVAVGTPLGLTSQRSTCVVWDAQTGEAVTPLISWQDRRAAAWCQEHQHLEAAVNARTGLPLSPHYAGPKLAFLMQEDASFAEGIRNGSLKFGTLDTYLVWQWTQGEFYQTDLTMAARTLLADPKKKQWRGELFDLLGVSKHTLAAINASSHLDVPLPGGLILQASVGDQPAGLIGALGTKPEGMLINIGTGTFVLHPTERSFQHHKGYLSGPYLSDNNRGVHYAVEGTINGGAATLTSLSETPLHIPAADPTPEAFCLPDTAGLGAPYWRPEIGLTFSESLAVQDQQRVYAEGLIFRVVGIAQALRMSKQTNSYFIAGGGSQNRALIQGLATCLESPVYVIQDAHAGLRGVASLACDKPLCALDSRDKVPPSTNTTYLTEKFLRWTQWVEQQL